MSPHYSSNTNFPVTHAQPVPQQRTSTFHRPPSGLHNDCHVSVDSTSAKAGRMAHPTRFTRPLELAGPPCGYRAAAQGSPLPAGTQGTTSTGLTHTQARGAPQFHTRSATPHLLSVPYPESGAGTADCRPPLAPPQRAPRCVAAGVGLNQSPGNERVTGTAGRYQRPRTPTAPDRLR